MSEGVDKYGAEYKRTKNDFKIRRLEQDNCVCNICHGTGAKFEVEYITKNYESARRKGKICKELQAHEHRIWICQECVWSFKKAIAALYMAPVQCNLLKVDRTGRVCCVKDTCDGCPHIPGECAIEDLVRDAGLFDSWEKWDFPTFYVCDEMQKLRDGLTERGIEWKDETQKDSAYWICRTHYEYNKNKWSVVHGFGSYGGFSHFSKDAALLECMHGGNEPVGWLTAEDVFKMMEVDE